MECDQLREALARHWAASDANDFETEHEIYREDAVLEYPQSGERIRGRRNIQASRAAQPNQKRFTVRRIVGAAQLWVTEFILTYDGQPSYTVSIMEPPSRDGSSHQRGSQGLTAALHGEAMLACCVRHASARTAPARSVGDSGGG
jgi:ketosteroid isomerase-like protein